MKTTQYLTANKFTSCVYSWLDSHTVVWCEIVLLSYLGHPLKKLVTWFVTRPVHASLSKPCHCFRNMGKVTQKLYIVKCNFGVYNFSNNLILHVVFVSTVTNKKPSHVSITKVKQFQGSSAFVKRSQWTIDQLRQVNGIDANKVCKFVSKIVSVYLNLANIGFWNFGLELQVHCWLAISLVSLLLSPRTVQSLTWCSIMPLTSGLLVQQEKSAPLSKYFTTPASATARCGNQSLSTVSPNCWGVRCGKKKPFHLSFVNISGQNAAMTLQWQTHCCHTVL